MLLATLWAAALTAAACAAPGGPRAPAPAAAADTLRALYEHGASFDRFLARARARRSTWREHYAAGRLAPDVAARLAALRGTWRLLVVAEDWCGDSANTIPFVATLADSSGGRIELRVVNSEAGRGILESHRTADGRAATPTVVLLDAAWREVGCWVERPGAATALLEAVRAEVGEREAVERKYAWYREDGGQSTLRDILTMIETAAPGRSCGGNAPPAR